MVSGFQVCKSKNKCNPDKTEGHIDIPQTTRSFYERSAWGQASKLLSNLKENLPTASFENGMYDWTANINVILRDSKNDITKMQVNVFGSVLIANTNAYGQVLINYGYEKKSCVSTGVMENEFKQFLIK